MHKVLLVSLSAALISVKLSGMAEAAYTERDVNRMEDLISAGNWVDLRIFLLANPRVLNGTDPFSQQLQKFLDETDSLYTALTFDPSIFPDVNVATPTAPPRRVVRTNPNAGAQRQSPAVQSSRNAASSADGGGVRGATRAGAAVSIY